MTPIPRISVMQFTKLHPFMERSSAPLSKWCREASRRNQHLASLFLHAMSVLVMACQIKQVTAISGIDRMINSSRNCA